MLKRFEGFISWFDERSGEGIISDFERREWYFNFYDFPETHYIVTGICNKTGKTKTIKTRHYPGMFMQHKLIRDDQFGGLLKPNTPVSFEQVLGLDQRWALQRWAVKLRIKPKNLKQVLSHRLLLALDSWYYCEETNDFYWIPYSRRRVEMLLREIERSGL